MGTCNFNIKNRCVVMTDDDYEVGNMPKLNQEDYRHRYSDCRDFMGCIEEEKYTKDLITTDLVAFSGYYQAGSIDFRINHDEIRDELHSDYGYNNEFKNITEFLDDLYYRYDKIPKKLIVKAKKQTVGDKDLAERIESIISILEELIFERDEEIANKMLDLIKKDYGYSEYEVSARFSSGETHYKKVS